MMAARAALFILLAAVGQAPPAVPDDIRLPARAATVRVRCADRAVVGSGVIVGQKGAFVYLLTANHVVAGSDAIEVSTFSAQSHPRPEQQYRAVEVVDRLPLEDLALLRLTSVDPLPGLLRVCRPGAVPAGRDFAALTTGCTRGEAPSCEAVTVRGLQRVRRLGDGPAVPLWELAEAITPGRSGGALVDRRGELIGIISLTSGGRGYCCHTDAIHTLLKRNGLGPLLK